MIAGESTSNNSQRNTQDMKRNAYELMVKGNEGGTIQRGTTNKNITMIMTKIEGTRKNEWMHY